MCEKIGGQDVLQAIQASAIQAIVITYLAEATLVANKGLAVLVVDVAAGPALVGVFAAVGAVAVAVGHRARAPRALQPERRRRLGVLVEVQVLDLEVERCVWGGLTAVGWERRARGRGVSHYQWVRINGCCLTTVECQASVAPN